MLVNEYGGKAKSNGRFVRNKYGSDGLAAIKNICGDTDIFESVFSSDGEDIYGPLYFDLDGDISSDASYEDLKNDVNTLYSELYKLGLEDEDIDLYFSGSKGYHVLVSPLVLGIKPSKDLNLAYKRYASYLSEKVGIKSLDMVIYDKRRLLRMPNTINSKSGSYKLCIGKNRFDTYTREELITFSKNPLAPIYCKASMHEYNEAAAKRFSSWLQSVKSENNSINVNKNIDTVIDDLKKDTVRAPLPCVLYILENEFPEGKRNNALYNASLSLKQAGYSYDQVLSIMIARNNASSNPLDINEVVDPIKSIYRHNNTPKCWIMQREGYCQHTCPLYRAVSRSF